MKNLNTFLIERLKLTKNSKLNTLYEFIDIEHFKDGDKFYIVDIDVNGDDDCSELEIADEEYLLSCTCTDSIQLCDKYPNLYNFHYNIHYSPKDISSALENLHKTNILDNKNGKMFLIMFVKNFWADYVDDMSVVFSNKKTAEQFIDDFYSIYKEEIENYLKETNIFHNDGD